MNNHAKTICVVDDDPSVCKALSRLVKSAGFKAKTNSSAIVAKTRALKAGAVAFLRKPFGEKDLLGAIYKGLG